MTDWIAPARLLLEAGRPQAARAAVEAAARAWPEAPAPLLAEAELAALADDYIAARLALTHALARAPGLPALPPCLTEAPEVRLRLAQLWPSIDGRNRASVRMLWAELARLDWVLPAVHSGHSPESYAAAVAPVLDCLRAAPPHPAGELSFWRDWLDPTDGPWMRAEIMVTQAAAHRPGRWGAARLREAYRGMLAVARAEDAMGLLPALADDGAFAALRMRLDGEVISRDQLDGAQIVNWLAARIGLARDDAPLLVDVGAGYGRLVLAMLRAFPQARALALDAVPQTSAMAWLHLRHRGLEARAQVGGPRRLLQPPPPGAPRIASNVNSWSEAPLASIRAWLELLHGFDWLLLVTHDETAVTLEQDAPPQPMLPAIRDAGWRLAADRPRWGAAQAAAPDGRYADGHMWLFRRG